MVREEYASTTGDPRTREIQTVLIRHLHGIVREVGLTEAEWLAGIRFLTATGQPCADRRQGLIATSIGSRRAGGG